MCYQLNDLDIYFKDKCLDNPTIINLLLINIVKRCVWSCFNCVYTKYKMQQHTATTDLHTHDLTKCIYRK